MSGGSGLWGLSSVVTVVLLTDGKWDVAPSDLGFNQAV